jgi:hypothetical protein
MIPARRDGMLTEIPLVIQILKSVYMIPPLIPPERDEKFPYKHFIPPSRDEKFPYKHFIPARRNEFFPFEHA